MFQSTHPDAELHAAARAISGGPVYVSDAPDAHSAALLRSLVLPDGSVLRCEHGAKPTRQSLFDDPNADGTFRGNWIQTVGHEQGTMCFRWVAPRVPDAELPHPLVEVLRTEQL